MHDVLTLAARPATPGPSATRPTRLMAALAPRWFDEFVGERAWGRLKSHYADCVIVDPTSLTPEAWSRQILQWRPEAILSGWGTPPIPPQAMPTLRLVAHTAGTVRHFIPRQMVAGGLLVTTWGAAAAPTVAECALMLVLCCLRRVNHWSFVMHQQRGWSPAPMSNPGDSLLGRRVGIHGVGNVTRHFVRMLAPFGCDVRAYSAGVPDVLFAECGVERVTSLDALFDHADVLVEAEALNADTAGSVTESLLRRLPQGGVFVNVGRGGVVDERGLERVAAEGNLQIGLDVYDHEPLASGSPLRGLANVTLLPHVAGPTCDQRRACGLQAINALCDFSRGRTPQQPLSLEAYDRST